MAKNILHTVIALLLILILGEAILDRTYYDILGNFLIYYFRSTSQRQSIINQISFQIYVQKISSRQKPVI
jgi:hypothetical protein